VTGVPDDKQISGHCVINITANMTNVWTSSIILADSKHISEAGHIIIIRHDDVLTSSIILDDSKRISEVGHVIIVRPDDCLDIVRLFGRL
jgi:hypothetical protein